MEKNIHIESDHSVLDAPRIRTIALDAGYSSVNLYDEVDSTTTRARELLMDGTDPEREQLGELSVYASLYQSAGRGRLARVWTAPPGACLAASIVVRPHVSADPLARELPEGSYHWLTLIAGLSVVDIWRGYGVDAALKWPNDVIAQGAKGCGILAQLVPESGSTEGLRSIIVGIGQNTNMSAEQLPVPTATSLSLCTGQVIDSSEVLTRLLSIFARRYHAFVRAGGDPERPDPLTPDSLSLLDQARAATATLGASVRMSLPDGSTVEGTAEDLDAQGRILIRREDGALEPYAVGDIEHLRPANGSYGDFQQAH
ncbi:biotin--[acetyl-CoA-carboxylase] ligase [Rothia sp. HMSC069C10]|mgnify:FL=1|uniref:biotin--[acetyl-CoA-carboxylase] ligase n=1 Tax=Rothia sp. HMSC069C10 TaxID=1739346 RepID=UPI0008A1DB62|nr:biotin--[acetyl-CoA-carboxylase] ligase [Rothia sp. HMSC069C10]OFJ78245.1 biotin--[acetyl-CoA-carboxylase] ligase [Rothia sp. HMSC069C10]